MRRAVAPLVVLLAIAGAGVVQWRTSGGPSRAPIPVGDRLVVVGYEGRMRGTISAVADAQGAFNVDLATAIGEHPVPAPDRPLWRGYHVDIEARDAGVAGQMVVREIQTVNTTLVSTRNHAGGGYFLPGDAVQ